MWPKSPALALILLLNLLNCFCDAVRLIIEEGLRKNSHFYHNGDGGYGYHFHLRTETSIYFKCMQYDSLNCRGRAILRLNGEFRQTQDHNHLPNPDLVGERHFRANILDRVRNARFASFHDIVERARQDRRYSRTVRMGMNLRRLRTPMYRARMGTYPPLPQTLRQLTQVLLRHPRISFTVDREENMYSGSITAADDSHHVLFISPRMRQVMQNCTLIQGDGTFRARPAIPPSSQCFVLVTTYKDGVIPLAWALMENKTYEGYSAVFRLLKQVCPNLNPTVVISDWELPLQMAWRDVFPRATIQGCLWHLGRAFVKKANKLRIFRFHQAYPQIINFIRKAATIALLPEGLFDEAFEVLKRRALEINHVAAYILRDFFDYVGTKWLAAPFRREYMNFWRCVHRTNNSCESHNRMLRKAVGAYRPNVYAFIEALARLEHTAHLDYTHMRAGGDAKASRRWRSVYNDRQIDALCNDLENDIFYNRDETIWNFLERASRLTQAPFHEHIERELER